MIEMGVDGDNAFKLKWKKCERANITGHTGEKYAG